MNKAEKERARALRKLRVLLKRHGGRIANLYNHACASPEVEKFRWDLREGQRMTPEKWNRVAI